MAEVRAPRTEGLELTFEDTAPSGTPPASSTVSASVRKYGCVTSSLADGKVGDGSRPEFCQEGGPEWANSL